MQGSATGNGADTSLSNTYLGANIFIFSPYESFSRKAKRMRNQHKVVLNYIMTGGDTSGSTDVWNGKGGYVDNAFIAQYQFKF